MPVRDSVARARLGAAALLFLSSVRCSLVIGDLPDPIGGAGQRAASGAANDGGVGLAGQGVGGLDGLGGKSSAGSAGSRGGKGGTAADPGGAAGETTDNGGAAGGGSGGEPEAGTGQTTSGGRGGEGGEISVSGTGNVGGTPSTGGAGADNAGGTSATGGTGAGAEAGTGGTPSTGGSGTGATGGGPPDDCDRDDDGYDDEEGTCGGTDCDDGDLLVNPGQTAFFSLPRSSGGYDYDCDDDEEPELDSIDCSLISLGDCGGEGFEGSQPECGQSASWIACTPGIPTIGAVCLANSDGLRTLRCR